MNAHAEAYTVENVTALPGGLQRVDLANQAPYTMGWYQVGMLDAKQPKRLYSNRQLWAGINTPLWRHCKAWFPERGRIFIIARSDTDRTTMDIVEGVDLKAAGVRPGDWFTIYAIEPDPAVSVPSELTWRREAELPVGAATEGLAEPTCSTVRATNTAALTMPAQSGMMRLRTGDGPWQEAKTSFSARRQTVTVTLDGSEHNGQAVWLLSDGP